MIGGLMFSQTLLPTDKRGEAIAAAL
jgi:hypothetical protein